MKKYFFILLASVAALFVSCSKELNAPDTQAQKPVVNGKTITFTATIEQNLETSAALEGLSIKWQSGDYVGIAADNSATIVPYEVTVDPSDATKCTITVTAVEGASTYYAIFRGSLGADGDTTKEVDKDDFSGLTFNTSTKTFSGLTVGKQQVADGSLSSHLWYTNGFPLSMAGKSDGNSLVMKPCLALVKVQIASASVPSDHYIVEETYNNPTYNVNHPFSYSAVRGFNLYQIGASTVYSSGDYTVEVASDGSLNVAAVVNDNKSTYRQISQTAKLKANNPYYMCLIPGGSLNSFKIDFLGYSDDAGTVSWDAVYTMAKNATASSPITVAPGDFYDLGTLNPLGRKQTKNHSEADAADAAAAAQAVTIDGTFTDWTSVTNTYTPSGSGIVEWKYTYDDSNIYFYYKVAKTSIPFSSSYNWGAYIPVALNYDNLASTGSDAGFSMGGGYDAVALIYPWRGTTEGSPEGFVGVDGNGYLKYPISKDLGHILSVGSSIDGDYSYVEVSIPRDKIGSPTGTITVNHGLNWSPIGGQQINIGGPQMTYILASDQTVDVGKTVSIGATTNSTNPISYVSGDTSIATVDASGVITGVAVGSTTITLSVAASGTDYTAATKTINVTVNAAFTPAIVIDGDFDDWIGIGASFSDDSKTRIREWRFKNDERFVYFYFKLRKNRVDSSRSLCIIFDTDNDSSSGYSGYGLSGAEQYVVSVPFTNNGEASQPVCVNGYDGSGKVNGSSDASAIKAWAYDDGSSLSSSSSNIYLEVSIPRSKLTLPSTRITVSCSYNDYTTAYVSLSLE